VTPGRESLTAEAPRPQRRRRENNLISSVNDGGNNSQQPLSAGEDLLRILDGHNPWPVGWDGGPTNFSLSWLAEEAMEEASDKVKVCGTFGRPFS